MLKASRSSWARLDISEIVVLTVIAFMITGAMALVLNFAFKVDFGYGVNLTLILVFTGGVSLVLCILHGMHHDGNPV